MRWLVVLFVAACSGPISGTRIDNPRRPPGPPVASAFASEPGGIRVLANARAGEGDAGLLATNAEEYAALWEDVGLGGAPPAIDFGTHVVLGTNWPDGVCQPELVAAHVDAAGILTFEGASVADACIALLVRAARVVAVPRSILPPRFVWRTGGGDYAFSLSAHAAIASRPTPVIDTGARTAITDARGTVELPAVGRIAVRSLDDGRAIWVARRDAEDISVLLADRPTKHGIHAVVQWNDKAHRFWSEHDSRGRSIHGGAPLQTLSFSRVDAEHIAIGEAFALATGPTIARANEPALDGPDKPYTSAPVSFRAIADGKVGVLDDSIVVGLDGQARLCTLPEGKARQFLPGCHRAHPALTTFPIARGRRGISMIHGPIAIRRTGEGADLAIDLGSGASSWTVEGTFKKPAERGPTRRRGALVVHSTATGSTDGAFQQFNAPPECVPYAGRGSPEERWTFTARTTATYLFELDATYDGTLALVDKAGNTIACNDDAKGSHRRSLINIALDAGTEVAVMVDGFGGDRGSYKLTIHEQPTLPRLVVGSSVSGDTTRAIDQESHGCYAPAGDHRIPLRIEAAGLYAFRIDTPGWAPMISVFRAGGDEFGCYTHLPPLVSTQRLEPGEHFVVIDGNDKKQRGRYTLSVERCPTEDEKRCKAGVRERVPPADL